MRNYISTPLPSILIYVRSSWNDLIEHQLEIDHKKLTNYKIIAMKISTAAKQTALLHMLKCRIVIVEEVFESNIVFSLHPILNI